MNFRSVLQSTEEFTIKKIILFLFTLIPLFTLSAESKNADTVYDDPITTEFCLSNSKEQNFCIYHSLKCIEGFDFNTQKLDCCEWNHKDYMGLKVYWLSNERIIRAYTSSPEWKTKRGIKVGDSLEKVREIYKEDGQLYRWDASEKKSSKITNKTNYSFEIFDYGDDDGINICAPNMHAEEIMTLIFYARNGVITKIDIRCGEMLWNKYDKEHN